MAVGTVKRTELDKMSLKRVRRLSGKKRPRYIDLDGLPAALRWEEGLIRQGEFEKIADTILALCVPTWSGHEGIERKGISVNEAFSN